ncbi:hypothetical protein DPMN_164833 [Dreissena polymorpha]|uniref:Uncharacterized protein n=1 Tax=Dreissena polymorpha TaxID=45954 RepID=A0A9D4IVT3_DREPO|nr:hypothetical protein DPMN_164833 [Dreissena polymorpha]
MFHSTRGMWLSTDRMLLLLRSAIFLNNRECRVSYKLQDLGGSWKTLSEGAFVMFLRVAVCPVPIEPPRLPAVSQSVHR